MAATVVRSTTITSAFLTVERAVTITKVVRSYIRHPRTLDRPVRVSMLEVASSRIMTGGSATAARELGGNVEALIFMVMIVSAAQPFTLHAVLISNIKTRSGCYQDGTCKEVDVLQNNSEHDEERSFRIC